MCPTYPSRAVTLLSLEVINALLFHPEVSLLVQSEAIYLQATDNLTCADPEVVNNSLLVLNNLVNDATYLEVSFQNALLPTLFSLLSQSTVQCTAYICQIFKSLLRNSELASRHSPQVLQILYTVQLKQLHRSNDLDTSIIKMNILVLSLEIPQAREWLIGDQILFHGLHTLSTLHVNGL